MRFLKYMPSSYIVASRNKREISIIKSFKNVHITVVSTSFDTSDKNNQNIDFVIKKRKLSKFFIIRAFQIIADIFVVSPTFIKKIHANVISCHDLTCLFIAWLSTIWTRKKNKPKLIYDSHEFEIGRSTGEKRSLLKHKFILHLERFLIKKCVFSIMVNNSIANEVKKIHRLDNISIVTARNIPNYWELDQNIIRKTREELCKQLNINVNSFIVMYHGGVTFDRGIETLIKVLSKNNNLSLVILGYGERAYIESLKKLIFKLNVESRVLFLEAVPHEVLWQYVGAADVGAVIAPNTCLNHYYMSPNKLFENIQSSTPIVGSNFPEIKIVIEKYNIGICVDPDNEDEINSAFEKMRTNKILYSNYKTNLQKAREELTWENEKTDLYVAYKNVFEKDNIHNRTTRTSNDF